MTELNILTIDDLMALPRVERPVDYFPEFTTWRMHNCAEQHRSARTYLRCSMKKSRNNKGKLTNNTFNFSGDGNYAVIHRLYLYDYSALQISLWPTEDDAYDEWMRHSRYCFPDHSCSGTCVGLHSKIVKVAL